MPVYKVKNKKEFAEVAARHLLDELIKDIHDVDDQADECGFADPDLLLILLSQIGRELAGYTAYMASGMYLAQGQPDKAVEIVSALLDDYMTALKRGVKLAKKKVATFDSAEQSAKEATDALLDRVLKSKRYDS